MPKQHLPPPQVLGGTLDQRSAMMRRGFQVAARLGHHGALPGGPYILPRFSPASAFGSSMDSLASECPAQPDAQPFSWGPRVSRFCQEKTDFKNYTLPNASWYPDMLNLYHEFPEKTKADGWIRLPSFKSSRNHIQGLKLPLALTVTSDKSDCRIFTRCIETEGQGYEYVIFFHPSKKKSVCLFQPGPYLEGPQGKATGRPGVGTSLLLPGLGSGDGLGAARLWDLNVEEKSVDFDWFDQTGSRSVSFPFLGKDGGGVVPALALLPAPTPRFAHGGSLAAMIDETFSETAYLAGEGLFTLNLNITFKKARISRQFTPKLQALSSSCSWKRIHLNTRHCAFRRAYCQPPRLPGTYPRAARGVREVTGEPSPIPKQPGPSREGPRAQGWLAASNLKEGVKKDGLMAAKTELCLPRKRGRTTRDAVGLGRRERNSQGFRRGGILCSRDVRLLEPALGARRAAAAKCAASLLLAWNDSGRRGRSKRRQVGLGPKDGSAWRSLRCRRGVQPAGM
ncbi:hypothetical protein E2I00_011016, partial [Balaenoptera physalus]